MQSAIAHGKRLVVKVGSSLVTNKGKGIDVQAVAHWARQIAALHAQGKQMVLVSSGAIAEGMARLGWPHRPNAMHELQAAAAVGQMGLVQAYEVAFAEMAYEQRKSCLPTKTWPIAGGILMHAARSIPCWRWALCPSSMKTILSSPMKFDWVTTIHWARWSPT